MSYPQHEAVPSHSKGLWNLLLWVQKRTQMGRFGDCCGHWYPQTSANPPQNGSKMGGKGEEKGWKGAYRHR